MKRRITLAVSATAALIVLLTIGSFVVRLSRNAAKIPKPIHQQFNAWHSPWITPPLASADYWITLDYAKGEAGRLDEPAAVTLIDETTGQAVSTSGHHVGATCSYEGFDETIAGEFRAIEGHQYKIDVEPSQVAQLRQYRHRLTVDISGAERSNRMVRALRE